MTVSKTAGLRSFINRLLGHSALGDKEQAAILALPASEIDIQPRQDFGQAGEEVSHACLISSGVVARFGQIANGRRQIIGFHIEGDMPDLHSVIRPIGMGGLTTLTRTRILRIHHKHIRQVATRFPGVGEALWRDTLVDAAVATHRMISIGRRSARARVAHLFCEMSIRMGGNRRALLQYDFPVVQEHLADATGMTPVHLNRCLKSLEHDGLLMIERGKVHIYDWAQLAKIGGFDGAYLLGREAGPTELNLIERTGADAV